MSRNKLQLHKHRTAPRLIAYPSVLVHQMHLHRKILIHGLILYRTEEGWCCEEVIGWLQGIFSDMHSTFGLYVLHYWIKLRNSTANLISALASLYGERPLDNNIFFPWEMTKALYFKRWQEVVAGGRRTATRRPSRCRTSSFDVEPALRPPTTRSSMENAGIPRSHRTPFELTNRTEKKSPCSTMLMIKSAVRRKKQDDVMGGLEAPNFHACASATNTSWFLLAALLYD